MQSVHSVAFMQTGLLLNEIAKRCILFKMRVICCFITKKSINQSIKSVRRRSVPLSLTWIYLPFGKYNKNNRENDT